MDIIFSTLMLLYHLVTGTGEENVASKRLAASLLNASAGQTIIDAVPAMNSNVTPEAVGDGVKADPQPEAPGVKGVYVTAHSAGGARLNTLLNLMDDTALNSMVIDIKDDNGYITYPTKTPELLKLGTTQKFISDIHALMTKLEAHKVYPIARIVVFKDTVLAKSIRILLSPPGWFSLGQWQWRQLREPVYAGGLEVQCGYCQRSRKLGL